MRLAAILFCLAGPAMSQPLADIVILGEVHDNAAAHLGQAAVLENLQPTAVVFEMLTDAQARRADADRTVIADAWATSGWDDYHIYAPIFDALGDARIIGAAAPRDAVRTVYSDGPGALFGADAARFGLDRPLSTEEQAKREALQFDAHCAAMPIEMMAGMVAVQRYRDAVFARAALDALETYGPPVAVITGNGHARTDWGVPTVIAMAAPDVSTHAIAFVENETDIPFDEIQIVPPAKRDDPCETLKTN